MDVTQLADVRPRPRRVAVGEFDGVHLGHRRVIGDADTVLTFEPHPAAVVDPARAPKLLTSLDLKAELIAELGVSELVVIPFDDRFAHQTPEAFIDHVLVETLGATEVAVGDNFRFGHGARGSTDLLGADPRFRTRVEPLVAADGETISSSRIRELLRDGHLREANRLLGRPFRIRGEVIGGDRRGRELGFPTANLAIASELLCPAYGVYACWVGDRPAAVSVGVRPTFGDGLAPLVEAHLLDFSGDLYGRILTVEFHAFLRGEARFATVEPLIAQMRADVAETRRQLGAHDAPEAGGDPASLSVSHDFDPGNEG
ncbi:bifunctional riboflavin kinase/FAD synthetase [Conexibacter sp. DBS9H8]|uniref:bifunctional riboflavin kinase/FAD synthetase n=1 Tax=Conexibacter sp. DBS9H8 TaxID=2937801 RepID=UPI0020105BE6|nr:bifunctional riboflavin kinase/FAD synthetase [Conexibacter sp. DBS9H8]